MCILIEIRQLEWFFQSKTGKIVSKTRISIPKNLILDTFSSEKTRIDGFYANKHKMPNGLFLNKTYFGIWDFNIEI